MTENIRGMLIDQFSRRTSIDYAEYADTIRREIADNEPGANDPYHCDCYRCACRTEVPELNMICDRCSDHGA